MAGPTKKAGPPTSKGRAVGPSLSRAAIFARGKAATGRAPSSASVTKTQRADIARRTAASAPPARPMVAKVAAAPSGRPTRGPAPSGMSSKISIPKGEKMTPLPQRPPSSPAGGKISYGREKMVPVKQPVQRK